MQSDPFASSLGIELVELRSGYARMRLQLEQRLLNFIGIPHGAVVFALADQAFAAACNSRGWVSVALNANISFLAAARPNARLTAIAEEMSYGRKTGSYQVWVEDDEGRRIATFHGLAYRLENKRGEE
jgi:acyl-CoA thioesterase